MLLRTRIGCEIKAAGAPDAPEMTFSGYGSVFGVLDAYDDIIEPGAFSATISQFKSSGVWPAMLAQHGGWRGSSQDMTPVGVWTEMREDDHGLYVEGKLADTPRGRELYTLMKMTPRPAINGLSIGYYVTDFRDEEIVGGSIRHITGIDLVELSLVTFPANEEARIENVKSGQRASIRDAERALREAGFSRSEAKGILAGGYKSLSLRDAGDGDAEIAALLRRNISALMGEEIKNV